jgi:hypothetical protein
MQGLFLAFLIIPLHFAMRETERGWGQTLVLALANPLLLAAGIGVAVGADVALLPLRSTFEYGIWQSQWTFRAIFWLYSSVRSPLPVAVASRPTRPHHVANSSRPDPMR